VELADSALERGINQLPIRQILAVHIFAVDFLERVVKKLLARRSAVVVAGRLRGAQINVRAQRQVEHQRHQHEAEDKTAIHLGKITTKAGSHKVFEKFAFADIQQQHSTLNLQ